MFASENGFKNPTNDFVQRSQDFVIDIPDETGATRSSSVQNFMWIETQEEKQLQLPLPTRRSSIISIVVTEGDDLKGSYDSSNGPSGFFSTLITDDTEIKLSLASEELTYLRWYLLSTAQWFPNSIWERRKRVCKVAQYLVLVLFIITLVYDSGAFKNRIIPQEEMSEVDKPMVVVKNVFWDLRFLVMTALGIHYGRKEHLEQFLLNLTLTRKYWMKARRSICKITVGALCGVLLLPVGFRTVKMAIYQENERFTTWQITVNSALSSIVRYYCLPIFFIFVHVVILICNQIRLFKSQIQQWPHRQKEHARNKLIDIKIMLKDAERAFQKFLIIQLCLLLIAFIPEVFSAAERLHTASYNQNRVTSINKSQFQENLQIANTTYQLHHTIQVPKSKENVFYIMISVSVPPQVIHSSHVQAPAESQAINTAYALTNTDYISIAKIIAAALLTDLIEIAILYSLPLVLLGKIEKLLISLPQTIRTLKFKEQRRKKFMFQTNEDVRSMLKELKSVESIQIWGKKINSLLAVLVTLSMPVLVTTLRVLLQYVEIKPNTLINEKLNFKH